MILLLFLLSMLQLTVLSLFLLSIFLLFVFLYLRILSLNCFTFGSKFVVGVPALAICSHKIQLYPLNTIFCFLHSFALHLDWHYSTFGGNGSCWGVLKRRQKGICQSFRDGFFSNFALYYQIKIFILNIF